MTPKKVLVVEDEATSRQIAANAAESLGMIAIQASDGQRGWEILNDNPDIALVITDVAMPNLSGDEFIMKVRQNPKTKALPVIIMSGIVTVKEIEKILQLGASRFLPKPIDVPMLRDYLINLTS